MLLTVTTTHEPATDLGFLLHKHPAKLQTFKLGFGVAHVFYPEASADRCTAALLLDLDPVSLVRGRPNTGRHGGSESGPLANYVNDRPYVASSFLSVALRQVFSTALGGRCETHAELVKTELPVAATVGPIRVHGGEALIRRLFAPLGYEVEIAVASDAAWPTAQCWTVSLSGRKTLQQLLTHLYVMIPVLDDEKHYWVGEDEIDKLMRHGDGWLTAHPERELITRRYLKHGKKLARLALDRLAELDDAAQPETTAPESGDEEQRVVERPLKLNERRVEEVMAVLRASGAQRVLDLGCGDGKLLRALLQEPRFAEIVGTDVAMRELEIARTRLELDRMPERQRERLTLLQSALTYRDRRLAGFDAAAVIEVIEHMDAERLPAFERAIFGFARPGLIVLTTPNAEYNVLFPDLAHGKMRHTDHRFEWTRAEFTEWAERTAATYRYSVALSGIGDGHPELGHPTQMAVFTCT